MIKKNVIISMLLLLFACQSNETSGRITFEELYDGDLANVSRIQIRSSNGELKSVIVKQEIGEWLESVQVLEFKREENLEGNHNPLYTVKLFEGDVVRLKFSPERIGDVYYEQNDTLIEKTEDLFDNQAIRKHSETFFPQGPVEVRIFSEAVETAIQLEGIVNMANPDYYFFLEDKLYGMWVSEHSGVII